jgi:hypothetical protein
MPRCKDIWRCGVLTLPVGQILAGGLSHAPVHWLPEEPAFRFLADPFPWRGRDHLHIFAERYDYATRHGTIDLLTLDERFRVIDRCPCLREAWHLSYPQIFDADGATWMLPEAYRSGGLTLYRMGDGPADWGGKPKYGLIACRWTPRRSGMTGSGGCSIPLPTARSRSWAICMSPGRKD